VFENTSIKLPVNFLKVFALSLGQMPQALGGFTNMPLLIEQAKKISLNYAAFKTGS
jgi:hypothetical protein